MVRPSQKEVQMSDSSIVVASRYAMDTGDFSKIEKLSSIYIALAENHWLPHEEQDRCCREYKRLPWWKKVFVRKPSSRALPYRARAADDLAFFQALRSAVAAQDVSKFTGR